MANTRRKVPNLKHTSNHQKLTPVTQLFKNELSSTIIQTKPDKQIHLTQPPKRPASPPQASKIR